jgi:hypothetical protein
VCRFLRKKIAARIRATPSTEPITMPAMAPADRDGFGEGFGSELGLKDDLDAVSGVELERTVGDEVVGGVADDEAAVELATDEVTLATYEAAKAQTPGVKLYVTLTPVGETLGAQVMPSST